MVGTAPQFICDNYRKTIAAALANYAIDGNVNTVWASKIQYSASVSSGNQVSTSEIKTPGPHWIELDLGKKDTLGALLFKPNGSNWLSAPLDVIVSYFDGSSWYDSTSAKIDMDHRGVIQLIGQNTHKNPVITKLRLKALSQHYNSVSIKVPELIPYRLSCSGNPTVSNLNTQNNLAQVFTSSIRGNVRLWNLNGTLVFEGNPKELLAQENRFLNQILYVEWTTEQGRNFKTIWFQSK